VFLARKGLLGLPDLLALIRSSRRML
jgi:hypothetical protein